MRRSATRSAVRLWSASERRRRLWSLVLLGVLAGVAAGLVTAAVSGAERSSSAYPRMRARLAAADAVFFPSQVFFGDADVTKLGSIPEVEAWSGFALAPGWFAELGPQGGPFITVGDGWFRTIERAKVLAGRLPDPRRDDEMVVNKAAEEQGAHIGSTLTLHMFTPADYERFGDETTPPLDQLHGPVVKMKVVGVVRMPIDFVLTFATEPEVYPSPGFYAQHKDQMAVYFTNVFVRLKHGATDLPAFQAHIAGTYGRTDIPVKDLSDDIKRVRNSTGLEHTALLLFAGAALLASLVLVGQAIIRSVQAASDTVPTLNAMGVDPPGLVAGLALPHTVTLAVVAVTTVITTYLLSPHFPIGLARQLDPDLGYHLQPAYLVGGALAAVVVTAAIVLGAAWLTTRLVLSRRSPRRTRVVGAASRAGASVPAAVGASLALEQTGGRAAVPVRSALAAAAVAIVGVVGAVTLVGGINDALHDPARSGHTWALEATPTSLDQVTHPPNVAGLQDMAVTSRFAVTVRGKDVPFYSLQDITGTTHFVVLHGRQPLADDEALIGPRSAKVLGARIGDTIRADAGGPPLRVVGIGLLPQTPHSAFDEGALVTMHTLDVVSGITIGDRVAALLITPAAGTKVADLQSALTEAGIDASPPSPVADVKNLANVRSLPYLLAGFLVVLGLGAVGHALLTVSRRRAKELAVLRAVGLSPRQAAACVTWQATVVATIALLIGIPLGLFVGQAAWRRVANSIPLVYVGPFDVSLLLVTVPATVVALLLLALAPAWRAARLRTAPTLRAE